MTQPLQNFFQTIRADFPAVGRMIYLDSAATTHKPRVVINAMTDFYAEKYATVHRAVYSSSSLATDLYNEAREKVARFLHAPSSSEIVFTRGTTDGLNILADSIAKSLLKPSSTILVSAMEHHSNLIPWQMAAQSSGARLEVIPLTKDGELSLTDLESLLQRNTVSVVSVTHASNVLGIINPIPSIAHLTRAHGALLIVDGAQSTSHIPIDVQSLGCDAFVFSAHKLYGPTGLGVLWAKQSLLNRLNPTRGGGDMVEEVSFTSYTPRPPPLKFEPGTPPIAEVVALGAAIEYLASIPSLQEWENYLLTLLMDGLASIPDLTIFGPKEGPRCPLVSFSTPALHPLDIATLLDLSNIAVRSGHMCCRPLLKQLNVPALTRASLALYNSPEDIDTFLSALRTLLTTHSSER